MYTYAKYLLFEISINVQLTIKEIPMPIELPMSIDIACRKQLIICSPIF